MYINMNVIIRTLERYVYEYNFCIFVEFVLSSKQYKREYVK